jgi:hypothetical protein
VNKTFAWRVKKHFVAVKKCRAYKQINALYQIVGRQRDVCAQKTFTNMGSDFSAQGPP